MIFYKNTPHQIPVPYFWNILYKLEKLKCVRSATPRVFSESPDELTIMSRGTAAAPSSPALGETLAAGEVRAPASRRLSAASAALVGIGGAGVRVAGGGAAGGAAAARKSMTAGARCAEAAVRPAGSFNCVEADESDEGGEEACAREA